MHLPVDASQGLSHHLVKDHDDDDDDDEDDNERDDDDIDEGDDDEDGYNAQWVDS